MTESVPQWLTWAREIQAITQTGLHYAQNDFDRQRYSRLAAISAEIIASHTHLNVTQLLHLYAPQRGYATPKVDVRAAIFNNGRLLMVRELMDGGWTMPGGWADVGDVPSQAAEREAWEEAGVRVRARRLVGVYDANRNGPLELFHAYKLIFLCDLVETGSSGAPAYVNTETTDVTFFAPGEIPAQLSGARTSPRHIQDAFALLADPHLPVVFD